MIEENTDPIAYNSFDENELQDFKDTINFYMQKADECLGVKDEGRDGILYRNLLNKSKNIDLIDRYKSEIFSNMTLATTRLRAIFELIDMEITNEESKKEIKKAIYKDFQKNIDFFKNELNRSDINEKNFHDETKKLKNAHFEFNTKVYEILKENNIFYKDLERRIDILNGLQNMHFEKKVIVTHCYIDKEKKYTRMIMDKAIEPLSDEMKGKIQNGEYKNDFWYAGLTKFQKDVFERYKNQIISGHPIPNMINFIPGVRNAFERIDIIQDENNKEIARTSLIHTAHPTVIKNQDSKNLTKQNVDHLQKVMGKKIFLSGLITPLIFNGGEKKMHKDLRDVIIKNKTFFEKVKNKFSDFSRKNKYTRLSSQENDNPKDKLLSYGNVPINMFRMFCLCLFKKRAMNNLMKESLEKIISNNGIKINENFNIKKLIKIADSIGNLDEKSQKILETIKFLDKNLNHISRFKMIKEQFKGNNLSVEINSNFHFLVDAMNDLNEKKSISTLFCKSGKDRTGIQQEYSIAKILSNKQNIFSEQDLLKNSIESGHLRFINGSQFGGNSAGLNGVLDRPMNVNLRDYKLFKDNLYNNVAASNHFKYEKKSFVMKFRDFMVNFFNKREPHQSGI